MSLLRAPIPPKVCHFDGISTSTVPGTLAKNRYFERPYSCFDVSRDLYEVRPELTGPYLDAMRTYERHSYSIGNTLTHSSLAGVST